MDLFSNNTTFFLKKVEQCSTKKNELAIVLRNEDVNVEKFKKRRGRPKKYIDENIQRNVNTKKRGRPKKHIDKNIIKNIGIGKS